ncbi:hypothetical protein [Agitococcus lubricus]|nr:hypothetical protein [Agitococcus lubricus]
MNISLEEIKERILSNPKNFKVLKYLKLNTDIETFSIWYDSGFDEGAQTFYYEYCESIPSEAFINFGIYNLVVCIESGTIFGFQFGRFTFFVRPNFEAQGILIGKSPRRLSTIDGTVNIESLEHEWVFLSSVAEEGEESICYKNAYYLAKKI